ncbi:MAG: excinuclease ABC subunit UvrC, partial [bacterium]|nr:excinuclease ABC subunit UvrC [bacterium]
PSPLAGEGRGEGKRERYQITFLMRRVADIDFVVTDNEKEALLLENTLIKKHKPRYNIFFKDDKSYASLKLNATHPFPGLFITRDIAKDGSLYFGPYASAGALRQTVDLLTKHFKLRTCSDNEFANRSRPCLEYHIGRCTAPCVGKISQKVYALQVEEAKLFLEGHQKELLKKLKEKMKRASLDLRYEEAAQIRNLIGYVAETLEKQKVVRHGGKDYDCVGFELKEGKIVFCVLLVRQGVLIDRKRFVFNVPPSPLMGEDRGEGKLSQFLLQYYGTVLDIPRYIYISRAIDEKENLKSILEERCGHLLDILSPVRGEKQKMVRLAAQNAKQWMEGQKEEENEEEFVKQLEEKLFLPQPPWIIECIDISNLQGKDAVGSLVCFSGKKPLKNRYRKFKIRLTEGPNDYAMMVEVLSRRFKRALIAESPKEKEKWSLPDLLMVDGGKGHLQIALKVLADLGLHTLPVIAIAKARLSLRAPTLVIATPSLSRGKQSLGSGQAPRSNPETDKIYIPGRKNPIAFKADSKELLYLMRIRDEAHRFGITYHRHLRNSRLPGSGTASPTR